MVDGYSLACSSYTYTIARSRGTEYNIRLKKGSSVIKRCTIYARRTETKWAEQLEKAAAKLGVSVEDIKSSMEG